VDRIKVTHLRGLGNEPKQLPDPINLDVLSVMGFDSTYMMVNGGYLLLIEDYNNQLLEDALREKENHCR
jgi:hypothetical protein